VQSVMGVKTGFVLICALAIGCVSPQVEQSQSVERAAMQAGAATCNQSICDTVCANGKNMKVTLTAYLACFNYLACACGPIPTPIPPEPSVGGQTAAGGTTSTGGASFGGSGGKGSTIPEQAACDNLSRLGCPEGFDVEKCASDMTLRCSNPKVKCATQCIVSAQSKSVVTNTCHVACGSL
jgi:hypothetical protein